MHTLAIIGKTLITVGCIGGCLALLPLFLSVDIMANRSLTLKQGVALLALMACAVGIWFM